MENSSTGNLAGAAAAVGQAPAPKNSKQDHTGMDRLAWNVLTSWGGHLVFVIAGFVMPRMIDRHVGQASLGIWDFSWSVVSYFGLASLGIGSAVNRHVALYRASGEHDRMRSAVSSVVAVQFAVGMVALMLTGLAVWLLPHLVAGRIQGEISLARWTVGLLGASLAVTMSFDSFRGVMTGCHRWDLHNGLNAGSYGLTVFGMMVMLWLGFGLRGIAALYLVLTTVAELARVVLAHRVCPELKIRFQYVSAAEMRHMLVFGGNNLIAGMTPLVVGQTVNLLIAGHLGTAALAMFSRPLGLVRSLQTFLNKFAFVLTPTAGSLQGSGRTADIRRLVTQATKMSIALSLPMITMLVIQGDIILRLWMGRNYEQGFVLSVLAIGAFLPMAQQPAMTILIGLNMHGKISISGLIVAIVGVFTGALLAHQFGWSLQTAAFMTAVPLTLANGVAIGIYACHRLEIPISRFISESFTAPFLCVIPMAMAQFGARVFLADRPIAAMLSGIALTGIIAAPLYYYFIAPPQLQDSARKALRKVMSFGREREAIATTEVGN